MRPDKKKKLHHDRVAKKKAALAKESQEDGKEKKKENSVPPEFVETTEATVTPATSEGPSTLVPPNFKGVRETGDKLINEANQRYLASESKDEEPKYAKRNITSNWTKFELPSSGDESGDEAIENMTGADFNYVLASATGAESHFRLKSEKEWDPDTVVGGGEFSNEFFSLDVIELERALNCVPFPQHIGVKEEDFEPENFSTYKAKSSRCMAAYGDGKAVQVEEEISQKIMNILTVEKEEKPLVVTETEVGKEKVEEKLKFPKPEVLIGKEKVEEKLKFPKPEVSLGKEKVEEKLKFPKPEVSIGLDQRQGGRKSMETENPAKGEIIENPQNMEISENLPKDETIKNPIKAAPLDQRSRRRQRVAKKQDNRIETRDNIQDNDKIEAADNIQDNDKIEATHIIPKGTVAPKEDNKMEAKDNITKDKIASKNGLDEKSDLEFLDSFDKPKQEVADLEEEKGGVVPVKIVKEKETANLEDWLDDFLDD